MDEMKLMERITIDQHVMLGKPVLRGTRLTVEFILNLLAHGSSYNEIMDEYPDVTRDDIHAVLLFASKFLENSDFLPLSTEIA